MRTSGRSSPGASATSALTPASARKPSVIVIAVTWGAMYGDLYEKGLKAITVSVRRNPAESLPPNVKSLNYLNNILAKIEANYKGGDEAIFFDTNGYVSEGSGDNLYIVKNGEIITPPTLNNLRGITRVVVQEIAESLGITVREQNLGYFDLYTADELICSGTAAEVAPITWVDGRVIGTGKPGPITRQLMAAFQTVTEHEGYPVYTQAKAGAKKPAAKKSAVNAVKTVKAVKTAKAAKTAKTTATKKTVKVAAMKSAAPKPAAKKSAAKKSAAKRPA